MVGRGQDHRGRTGHPCFTRCGCYLWDVSCRIEARRNRQAHAACESAVGQCVDDHCAGLTHKARGDCENSCTDIVGQQHVCTSDPCFGGVPCTQTPGGLECEPLPGVLRNVFRRRGVLTAGSTPARTPVATAWGGPQDQLELTKLTELMARTSSSAAVKIGLIDGPVAAEHPDLTAGHLVPLFGPNRAACNRPSVACLHGTFIAGMLAARRTSAAPGLCPGCTLLIRPIFTESTLSSDALPVTTPRELATAIIELCRKWCSRDQSESCPDSPVHGRSADVERRARPCTSTRRSRNRGCRKSRHPWQFGYHSSSLGRSGCRLRSSRQTDGRFEFWQFDWQTRPDGARGQHHQFERNRPFPHAPRDECRGSVRDRHRRAVVVEVSDGVQRRR